ncbi:hypothetical protein BGX31_001429, partial [Mortierella sp. GBA43]
VALSGVINARLKNVNNFFDPKLLDGIKSFCLREDYHRPEHVNGLNEVLVTLQGLPALFIKKDRTIDYKLLSEEITLLQSALIIEERKSNSENMVMAAVLDTILYLSKAKPSTSMYEAKIHQVSTIELVPDHDFSKGSGAKRLDLQCRVDDLEINNSEFKRCDPNVTKLEQQFPKNVLINHAIMLYLNDHIGLPLEDIEIQALDVNGTSFYLRLQRQDPEC